MKSSDLRARRQIQLWCIRPHGSTMGVTARGQRPTRAMAHPHAQRTHEQWLLDLTHTPTAAGREARVIAWITAWVARRRNLLLTRDRAGNLFIAQRRREQAGAARAPLFITAHLDHPAFVVLTVNGGDV